MQNILMVVERSRLASFLAASDYFTNLLAARTGVAAYEDSPRVSLIQSTATVSSNNTLTIALDGDLLRDSNRVIAAPGQNVAATIVFELQRGFLDTSLETAMFATSNTQPSQIIAPVSTQTVFTLAQQQGIPFQVLLPANQMRIWILSPFLRMRKLTSVPHWHKATSSLFRPRPCSSMASSALAGTKWTRQRATRLE